LEQTQGLDIHRYLQLVLKRRYLFAITAAALITAVVIISYLIPPVYEAKIVVSIEQSFLDGVLSNMGGAKSIDDKASALATIMKSRTLVFKVINELGIDLHKMTEAQIEGLIKNMQNKTQINLEFNRSGRRDVDFFTVSFRDQNPRFARDYVNTVVKNYIAENIGSKREGSVDANKFLLGQINQYKEKVSKIEAEITLLKKDRNVILYDRLLELQKRLEELLFQYTESHPEVIKVQSEIASLKAKFRKPQQKTEEADVSTDQSSERRSTTMAGAESIKNQLTVLERERESNKKIYDELTAAYSKSEVSTQAEVQDKAGTFRILDPAILPIKPVSPDRIKIILLGIIGGIAGAVALVVILDSFDKSVKNIDTLKSLGIPVLAIIPHIQDPAELISTRIKDICLYSLSGLFIVLLVAVIVLEMLG
jgi:succinoglycan biosynthesis transport protein ExoP